MTQKIIQKMAEMKMTLQLARMYTQFLDETIIHFRGGDFSSVEKSKHI